ncbi:MAG: response regulator [Pseudomonadota bacterium]
MNVLLVDDDESIRISMAYFFKNKTAVFKAVERAELGLDIIRDMGQADIVIADYKLPGINGLSFLEIVRKNCLEIVRKNWPNAVTLLITVHSSPELKSKAMRIGVHAFIRKPFSAKAIMDALKPV